MKAGDYPGGFERLVQHASGVDYTIVNGEVLIDHGEHTGAHSGQVIRNSWAETHAQESPPDHSGTVETPAHRGHL